MPLEVGLELHCCNCMTTPTCHKDMAPDNTILHPIAFASKGLTGAEQRYSNIEREALGILQGLGKFHHYCFGREVLIITDHKLMVSIFKKRCSTYCLKFINTGSQIIYKPGPKFFIADWFSCHNHVEGKDKPIKDMDIRIRCHTECDRHPWVHVHITNTGICTGWPLTTVKSFIVAGWPSTKDEIHSNLKPYWSHRDELAVNRQSGVKRQAYNHTNKPQTTGVGPTAHKSYGHRKN